MERIELKVVTLIKPGTDKIVEPQTCSSGERQGIDHALGDGLVPDRIRLVVENMDPAVPHLEEVDVAGQRCLGGEGNGKSQFLLPVRDTNPAKTSFPPVGAEADWIFPGQTPFGAHPLL